MLYYTHSPNKIIQLNINGPVMISLLHTEKIQATIYYSALISQSRNL